MQLGERNQAHLDAVFWETLGGGDGICRIGPVPCIITLCAFIIDSSVQPMKAKACVTSVRLQEQWPHLLAGMKSREFPC